MLRTKVLSRLASWMRQFALAPSPFAPSPNRYNVHKGVGLFVELPMGCAEVPPQWQRSCRRQAAPLAGSFLASTNHSHSIGFARIRGTSDEIDSREDIACCAYARLLRLRSRWLLPLQRFRRLTVQNIRTFRANGLGGACRAGASPR